MDTLIKYAKGVGEKREKLFIRLGIKTFGDMLRYFPRDYEDRTKLLAFAELEIGVPACFKAEVCERVQLSHIRKGMDICKTSIVDENGDVMDLVFFNAPYVRDTLLENKEYIFYGKPVMGRYRLTSQNPVFEAVGKAGRITGRILPVYSLTSGLSQGFIRSVASQALEHCKNQIPELLPEYIIERYNLCNTKFSYENIHFPGSLDNVKKARRRLVFEELLVLQLGLQRIKMKNSANPGIKLESVETEEFYKNLSFSLTNAQINTLNDIENDLTSGNVMHRLVQGDVGSGKTIIAAGAAYMVCQKGYQAAMMAPTALLAEQHYLSLKPLLEKLGIKTGLLTGAMPAKEKKTVLSGLADGDIDFAIGTHALFGDGVTFKNLALCVTDEQHRFGVAQRQMLAGKGEDVHKLIMSATPIPRTLAHIMYGDLELSIMNELPPGRKKVDTFVVDEGYRERIYAFIRKQTDEGRQVFIVCPLIEDENGTGMQAAAEYEKNLSETIFPDLKLGLIHGKQKAAEQEKIMRLFVSGEINILVATTVIEVGVNVPNASLMVVENAERFGLSQLHQLRGRVGRGSHKSYCVLFLQSKGDLAKRRLEALRVTNDGFAIAESDLELRGPGDFFGRRQHGLPVFEIADLNEDTVLLKETREEALKIMEENPSLNGCDALKEAIHRLEGKLEG